MSIEIKMPALSPTMEKGTLAKWLVKEGDAVKSGDLLAEIETDKATMEFEAIDEGVVGQLVVAEGTDDVPVGTVILLLSEAGEAPAAALAKAAAPAAALPDRSEDVSGPSAAVDPAPQPAPAAIPTPEPAPAPVPAPEPPRPAATGTSAANASPLARRLAAQRGIDLTTIAGSGPGGRVVRADLGGTAPAAAAPSAAPVSTPAPATKPAVAPVAALPEGVPFETVKLSSMRRTIARRLTESKQTVPHIYLTVDVQIDALLALRADLNESLSARGIKLSVNDMLIKAQAAALMEVSSCNVQFTEDALIQFKRADISVAVSIPGGLITPVVTGADTKSLSAIATEIKDLASRAREGKLKPHEFTGGTASLSNMGMYGIKQFQAIINPPQAMILGIGVGEKRPWIANGELGAATIMTATGSFDHRAIDGADGAAFMRAFKHLVENPLAGIA